MERDASSLPARPIIDPTTELRIHNARLEAEILSLKAILEGVRRRAAGIAVDMDRSAAVQAARLALRAEPVILKPRRWWSWPW